MFCRATHEPRILSKDDRGFISKESGYRISIKLSVSASGGLETVTSTRVMV